MTDGISIRGARLHNLKGIDVVIPRNRLVAVTGVSGSGKSSLAFDILFEEGRRQYLRALGVLQGLEEEGRFDSVAGLAPAIAVQQSIIRQSNPRSTVGSRTGLLGLLGMLYSGEGQLRCSSCGTPVDGRLVCASCGRTEERLQPSGFLYNAPNGMCTRCSGRGAYFEIALERLVPDAGTTLRQVFATAGATPGYVKLLERRFADRMDASFSELPEEVRAEAVQGHHGRDGRRSYCLIRLFQGRLRREGGDCGGLYVPTVCSECRGHRVGEEARSVLLAGRHVGELGLMTIAELRGFLESLPGRGSLTPLGRGLLGELENRTRKLERSKLGHLTLYREMPTLSGGELQRLFLHSHLESGMSSLIYVLDEPTIGLHESEKRGLLESLLALRDLGNTVVVVEHDRNTIEAADHIVDIGPKAGTEGGRLVYQGDLAGLLRCPESLTGRHLSRAGAPLPRATRRPPRPAVGVAARRLTIRNATPTT